MIFQLLFGSGRPQVYTVHEGPTPPRDRIDRAEALRFVKDGFSWPAFIFAPVWLATRKLWLALGGYVAIAALILLGDVVFDWPDAVAPLMLAGLHLVVGFEGDSIERATLEKQGWQALGSVTGTSALECERRFFDDWLPRQAILTPRSVTHSALPPNTTVKPAANSDPTVAGRLAALWRRQSS
jgi:hypothetical protein